MVGRVHEGKFEEALLCDAEAEAGFGEAHQLRHGVAGVGDRLGQSESVEVSDGARGKGRAADFGHAGCGDESDGLRHDGFLKNLTQLVASMLEGKNLEGEADEFEGPGVGEVLGIRTAVKRARSCSKRPMARRMSAGCAFLGRKEGKSMDCRILPMGLIVLAACAMWAQTVPNIKDTQYCPNYPSGRPPLTAPSTAAGDLRKVVINAPNAVCNDGSPAVMYVRSARAGATEPDGSSANRWVIHFEGGGSCESFEDCGARWCGIGFYTAEKMSSTPARESIGPGGLFRRNSLNPLGDRNQVILNYCSSDEWQGRKSDVVLRSETDSRAYSLHYLSPRQILYLIPTGTAVGAAQVAIGSQTTTVDVTATAPAIYSASQTGVGVAAATYLRITSAGVRSEGLLFDPNTRQDTGVPAAAGDQLYLILYGTGLRGGTATATVGGVQAPVAGPVAQGQYPGLDQINLGPLPLRIGYGQKQIVIRQGDAVANPVSVTFRQP